MNDLSRYWTTAKQLGLERSTARVESHTSPEIFAAEMERIYRRLWLMVGREPVLPGRPLLPKARGSMAVEVNARQSWADFFGVRES